MASGFHSNVVVIDFERDSYEKLMTHHFHHFHVEANLSALVALEFNP